MDLRIEKTYRALLTAFTELLETRRYEDVTVAMLCDAAMIRRTTFYKHFADKAEFFSFFIDNLRMDLLESGEIKAPGVRRTERKQAETFDPSSEEAGIVILQGLVDFMLEHETLVDNIFKSSMTGMMMLVMTDKVAETIRERYARALAGHDNGPVALQTGSEFAAGGIVRLLEMWWMSGHGKEGERAFITMANEMVTRVLGL